MVSRLFRAKRISGGKRYRPCSTPWKLCETSNLPLVILALLQRVQMGNLLWVLLPLLRHGAALSFLGKPVASDGLCVDMFAVSTTKLCVRRFRVFRLRRDFLVDGA
jgi:hypothetical protein